MLDRWEMVGRWLGEHQLHYNTQYNHIPSVQQQNIQCDKKPEPDGWVVGAVYFKNMSRVHLDRREMAGRLLGGCPWLFPKIAGVILDRYKIAGR